MKNDKTMFAKLQDEVIPQAELILASSKLSGKQYIISGIRYKILQARLKMNHIRIAFSCYKNPLDSVRSLKHLAKLSRQYSGDRLKKIVYSGDKHFRSIYIPGYNSKMFEKFIVSQLNDFKPINKRSVNRFNTVIIAITKKCVLRCEHCYEWDNLNKQDILSLNDLKVIIKKIQDRGVSHIQFSGGEPLQKMDVLIKLIEYAKKDAELWVATSGYKLNLHNAIRLKKAGLRGLNISLDHFIPEKHNAFRKFEKAYYWVGEAVKNAKKCNLVTSLSLCVTKEFISNDNLMSYMELAKHLGVSFVQILEPKAVGHYVNKDILLKKEHIDLLEAFFVKINFKSDYNSYPIITYHGYYQRRIGCFSAGFKSIYIDTNGAVNACPFCHKKAGNILDNDFDENLSILKSEGCGSYKIPAL